MTVETDRETPEAEAPETVVIVNNSEDTAELTPDTSQAEVMANAADSVVIAAQTAVAMAEAQTAIAEQEAAETMEEAAEIIEEVTAQEAEQDRSIEALWREVEKLTSLIPAISASLNPTPETEPSTPPNSSEEETNPTTEFSTPSDISAPTAETPTELIAESEPVAELLPEAGDVAVKRVRWM